MEQLDTKHLKMFIPILKSAEKYIDLWYESVLLASEEKEKQVETFRSVIKDLNKMFNSQAKKNKTISEVFEVLFHLDIEITEKMIELFEEYKSISTKECHSYYDFMCKVYYRYKYDMVTLLNDDNSDLEGKVNKSCVASENLQSSLKYLETCLDKKLPPKF